MRAYVGLGANLDQPRRQVDVALERLSTAADLEVLRVSRRYRSAPLGPPGQPDYCNAVCEIETSLWPCALVRRLQGIERAMGRTAPAERWGPRRIDLDLLHMSRFRLKWPGVTLPHPEAHRRNFVMVPLAEMAPGLEWHGHGRVAVLAKSLGMDGLVLWPGD